MYVLTILHGASMIVQKPMFYVYFVIPAILFTIDKMISLSRKRMEISILYLDGPYGAGQQDWYTYDVSVLVGAGIGVTPYASILKDFVHMTSIKSTYKIRCQKLYFIWVTGSQRHFEWLLDILQEVESIDTKGMVSIDIFITQFFQNFDLRTAMLSTSLLCSWENITNMSASVI
ncbi:DUOX1-like protein [Mya arenaria]|uniref:DUOX1-like protein n=1 Tax=Mya arenaria TaxID=6604 RepID=A0ABY7E874_MYAAR|nr:DUOX1-like protein [Mya arenaria]